MTTDQATGHAGRPESCRSARRGRPQRYSSTRRRPARVRRHTGGDARSCGRSSPSTGGGRTPGGTLAHLAAARHGHRAAYHGVRSPRYFAKAAGFAMLGVSSSSAA